MTPQTQPIDDVYAAEAELSQLEDALASEVNRLKAMRREASELVLHTKSHSEDPALVSALDKTQPPSVSVKAQVDEARLARLKALGVRKACVEKAQAALASHEQELCRFVEHVHEQEQAAKQRAVQKSAEVAAAAAKKKAREAKAAEEQEDSLASTMIRAIEQQRAAPTVSQRPAAAPQRRAAPRASLCAEITLGSDSNFFSGFTNDISEGGVFVATVNLLPLGTPIDLAFNLPGGPRIEGKGEVRWLREFDERTPDAFPGMGIKFTDIPLPSVAAIHAFAEQREPMFFPED